MALMNLFGIYRKSTGIEMVLGLWKLAAMTTMLAASRNGCLWKIYAQYAKVLLWLIIWRTNNWVMSHVVVYHILILVYKYIYLYIYDDNPSKRVDICFTSRCQFIVGLPSWLWEAFKCYFGFWTFIQWKVSVLFISSLHSCLFIFWPNDGRALPFGGRWRTRGTRSMIRPYVN